MRHPSRFSHVRSVASHAYVHQAPAIRVVRRSMTTLPASTVGVALTSPGSAIAVSLKVRPLLAEPVTALSVCPAVVAVFEWHRLGTTEPLQMQGFGKGHNAGSIPADSTSGFKPRMDRPVTRKVIHGADDHCDSKQLILAAGSLL